MSRKTALLDNYHIYGTASGVACSVNYRGKTLKTFDGLKGETPSPASRAKEWAKNQGFTHYKDVAACTGTTAAKALEL